MKHTERITIEYLRDDLIEKINNDSYTEELYKKEQIDQAKSIIVKTILRGLYSSLLANDENLLGMLTHSLTSTIEQYLNQYCDFEVDGYEFITKNGVDLAQVYVNYSLKSKEEIKQILEETLPF